MKRRIVLTLRLSHNIFQSVQQIFDMLSMLRVKKSLTVLTILFALLIATYTINDVNSNSFGFDTTKSNISIQNSQDTSCLGENGKNVLYFITTPQFQFTDSSSKSRKSDCGRGFTRNFRINHPGFTNCIQTSGFVSTFQSRFRKTCPTEASLAGLSLHHWQ